MGLRGRDVHALILGGADCRMSDVEALEAMMGRPWDGVVIAVNDAGMDWPRTLDHWVSLHAHQFVSRVRHTGNGDWVARRRLNGYAPARHLWGHTRGLPEPIGQAPNRWPGGSSGLYAVEFAARERGHSHIVLCGVPMDATRNSYHGADWQAYRRHREPWKKHAHLFRDRVRSMSGWTADLLGLPDPAWLGCDTLSHKVLHEPEEIPYIVP